MIFSKNQLRLITVLLIFWGSFIIVTSESDENPCTLLKDLAFSVGKCLKSGKDNVNIDSPKDVYNYLTDSNQRACLVKCTMMEQGFINEAGRLDTSGFLTKQNVLPPDMKEKLSLTSLQPCLEIAVNFEPEKCSTYQEFSNCILKNIISAFTPSALDCFTKVPGVGRVFAVIQSNMNSGEPSTDSGFFSSIREKISQGTDNLSNWMKVQKDKVGKLF